LSPQCNIVSLNSFTSFYTLNKTRERIFGLDLMRALAVTWVLLTHSLWINPDLNPTIAGLLGLGGTLGMESFFVLSGFLIGRILVKEYLKPNFKIQHIFYFWVRRWFRTLPNYYLILGVNVLLFWFYFSSIPKGISAYFYFGQNLTGAHPVFFPESWSLSIEEFSYIIGPLLFILLLVFNKGVKRVYNLWIGTIVILVFFLGTKYYYHLSVINPSLEYWNTHLKPIVLYRIDAIYYGVLAAIISMRYKGEWDVYKKELLLIGGIGLFVFFFILPHIGITIERFPFFYNVLYFPIQSVLIACLLPFLSNYNLINKTTLFYKVITQISIISYSVYLLHYSVVLFVLRAHFYNENSSWFESLLLTIAYFVITIVLSVLLYRFYEKPMMNLRDSKQVKRFFKVK